MNSIVCKIKKCKKRRFTLKKLKHYGNNFWNTSKKIGYIQSLSQEHGIIKIEKQDNYKVGDLLSIIPIHSCLTADKMGEYFCDNKKISMMKT